MFVVLRDDDRFTNYLRSVRLCTLCMAGMRGRGLALLPRPRASSFLPDLNSSHKWISKAINYHNMFCMAFNSSSLARVLEHTFFTHRTEHLLCALMESPEKMMEAMCISPMNKGYRSKNSERRLSITKPAFHRAIASFLLMLRAIAAAAAALFSTNSAFARRDSPPVSSLIRRSK